jgi:hypothetical protein
MHYTDMRLIFELQVVAAVPTLEDLPWELPSQEDAGPAAAVEPTVVEKKRSTFSRVFGWGKSVAKNTPRSETKTPPRPVTPAPLPPTPPPSAEIELLERHVIDVGALSVALGSGCCHKCAEALAGRLVEAYVDRFSGRMACGLDRVGERCSPSHTCVHTQTTLIGLLPRNPLTPTKPLNPEG